MKKQSKRLLSLLALGSIGTHLTLKSVGKEIFKKLFVVDKSYLNLELEDFIQDERLCKRYSEQIDRQIKWYKNTSKEDLNVVSYDGFRLAASLLKVNDDHHYMILMHGYNCDRYILLKQAYEFGQMGFNILMVDQRAYGQSEGEYTTFGFKEQFDLLQWIDEIAKKDSDARIGLYGVSMGAATVILALGNPLDQHVVLAIADSGYSTLKEEIEVMLKKEVPLLPSFLLNYVDWQMKEELGFGFDDVKPIEALKANSIPLCIIHAEKDPIVPFEMGRALYEADPGEKYFYPVASDVHAYTCYEDDYFKTIFHFIEQYK